MEIAHSSLSFSKKIPTCDIAFLDTMVPTSGFSCKQFATITFSRLYRYVHAKLTIIDD